MDAGLTLAAAALEHGAVMGAELTYETIVIDDPRDAPRPAPPYRLGLAHQLASLELGAAARSGLDRTGLDKFAPRPGRLPLVDLTDNHFVIVSAEDLWRWPTSPGRSTVARRATRSDGTRPRIRRIADGSRSSRSTSSSRHDVRGPADRAGRSRR